MSDNISRRALLGAVFASPMVGVDVPLSMLTTREWPWGDGGGCPYQLYEDWESWMRNKLGSMYSHPSQNPDIDFDDMPITSRIALYSVMCDLADGKATA